MAPERPLSPEKQLLKLIEDPKAKSAIAFEASTVKYNSLFSFGAWLGRFSFFKERAGKWFKSGKYRQPDNVKLINKILGCAIIFLTLYFLSNLSFSISNLRRAPNARFKMQPSPARPVPLKESSLLRAASYYLEKVRERDIFKMGVAGPRGVEERASREGVSKITELSQNLRLVGIAWSDDPDAMVEDTKAMRTFFIKRGQTIGDLKVRAIFKDKVILSYGTEEVELR